MNLPGLLRFTLPVFALLASVHAELKTGGSAIIVSPSALTANGKTLRNLEAGQAVTVLGTNSGTSEAVVSIQLPGGEKLVGMVQQSHLVAVDESSPASAATPAPLLNPGEKLSALQIAEAFKQDRTAAEKSCKGKRMTFNGVIEKVEIENTAGGTVETAVLTLKTERGLPRIKAQLSNLLGSREAFFRRYNRYLPYWWWGYGSRRIDLRLSGMERIQARAVYKSSSSAWFDIFIVGDPVEVEATCKGLHLDVEFEAGLVTGS